MADTADLIRRRFDALDPVLDEQARRRFAAAEARVFGRGGVTLVSKVTGIARSTINRGITEIEENRSAGEGRVRRPGGGRRANTQEDPTLLDDLQSLLEASTRGDPMSPLLWTSNSLDKLCAALKGMQHDVCPNVVAKLLRKLGYSLQSNRKTREGGKHPDRDAQFQYLDARMKEHMLEQSPVISVDTKKKELVGDFKNAGQELRPKASPEEVRVHDFIDRELGRAVPYGIYDIADNKGWVSVGVDHDTAAVAVNTIRRWWSTMGQERYPNAKRLMITADGGGSNGARVRLWKIELQKFVDEIGIPVMVCHLPPGTSKWNKACPREGGDRAPPVRVHHQELAW
jgi:transposase